MVFSRAMAKLWAKGYDLDELIEAFTVGIDYRLDRELVVADCMGSIAHARMLESIGILTPDELKNLETSLRAYAVEGASGAFPIARDEEDCHTAIENRLTSEHGDAGKKIHTCRSRNDQVLTALRLVERSFLLRYRAESCRLIRSLLALAREHRLTPMPGRTHLQVAMPSSVGLWASALAEQFLDQLVIADSVLTLVDRCPLGSAAGYGVPLPIDREMTARLLGFASVHHNVIAVAHSRGELEAWLLSLLDHTGLILSRFAQDLILGALPEFGYFGLPDELCTGSSIMPQKKNPDALELIRGKSSTLSGYAVQVASVIRSLPGGYNRDLQETKEPLLRGMRTGLGMLRIATRTAEKLEVRVDRLNAACTPELYATDAALEKVVGGMSFRDAYREVAMSIESLAVRDPEKALEARNHAGSAAHLGLAEIEAAVGRVEASNRSVAERVDASVVDLLGEAFPVYLDLDLA